MNRRNPEGFCRQNPVQGQLPCIIDAAEDQLLQRSAKWQKPPMPGITKENAKSIGTSKIAGKDQGKIGWKNTADVSRESK
jgi:hypothetical protein